MLFIQYPKCSTCKKAQKWLDDNAIPYETQHIVEDNPNKSQLEKIYELSGLPIKRLFNTSGMLYRELGIKDRLENMSEDESLSLLSTNGMLVKRPIILADDFALIGFKELEWTNKLL